MEPLSHMDPADTSALLGAAGNGEHRAADLLFDRLYDELRRLSGFHLAAEPAGATLSATGLVHDAYLKLSAGGDWKDRSHFMAVASRAMRQILIDRARARKASKRGGDAREVTLDYDVAKGLAAATLDDVLAVDEAITQLSARDEGLGRLVELRFFGGLEMAEVAEVLGVSVRTAARQWARAKAHLLSELA